MGKQRVVISSGDSNGGQDMVTKAIKASFTRPNNTAQYAAGDVIGNSTASPITFTGVAGVNGGAGFIVNAIAALSVLPSTKPNARLYLFAGTSTVTCQADNALWQPSDADMRNYIGHAEFSTWENGSGNCVSVASGLNLPFECVSSGKNIYGVLVERGTYTPTAQSVWGLRLGLLRG